ncbi:MAG: hypothetical protein WAO61_02690 [Solirubrobacterales bacterium]
MSIHKRILVVANETIAGRELHDQIKRMVDDDAEVKVVAPALSSRLKYVLSDVDGPRAAAQRRLDRSLELLAESGITATGEVGDANPVRAFKDQCAIFDPDAVVISTHPPGRSNWLEDKVVKKITDQTEIPVTHIVVDLAAEEDEPGARAA